MLAQAGAHGIEVLIEAIDYLHARPDARAAQLVEAWKDTPKGRGVARPLSQDLGVNDETLEIEFRDTIKLLTLRALEVESNRLLEESRSAEHTSELKSLMRTSYDVLCLNKKTHREHTNPHTYDTHPPRC